MDFSTEIEQHKVVHSSLEKLLHLIHSAQANHSTFKAEEMKELMIAFREPLVGTRWIHEMRILTELFSILT